MRWHNITVPERQLSPVLTAPRKPFSQRFWDLLSSESGHPMWPDAPQLTDGQRNKGIERIGKTLDYTIQTWKTGGSPTPNTFLDFAKTPTTFQLSSSFDRRHISAHQRLRSRTKIGPVVVHIGRCAPRAKVKVSHMQASCAGGGGV